MNTRCHGRAPRAAWATTTALAMAAALGMGLAAPAGAQEIQPDPNPPRMGEQPPALPPMAPTPAQPETLSALVARVLAYDPAVKVARALQQAADERRLQSRSRLGPSLGATVTRGGASLDEFSGPVDRRTDRADLALRWNLYNYGNDAAELSASERELAAATEEVRRAREEAAERIAEAYNEVLRVQQLIPRSQQRLDAVRKLLSQVAQQNRAGKVSDADLQQAQASALDAEVSHEQLGADLASAREKLALLTGGEVREAVPLVLPPPATGGTPYNGQVVAARERALAARARTRPPQVLLAPKVDAEYRKKLHDRTGPVTTATTTEQYGWTVTARWDFPVMGENQAKRAEAERRAEAAEFEADRVLRMAAAELATLPPRIAQTERALVQIDRQIEQYGNLVRAGELQFEAGRRTLPQLVQLHDSRFNAEQRRAEQAHRLRAAQLRLLALSGGLLPALSLGNE